jgi:rhodanese-related sulfurtransferase
LNEGLRSDLSLPLAPAEAPPALQRIGVDALAERLARGEARVIDLRAGMQFRAAHIPGARWAVRPRLAAAVKGENRTCVLVGDPFLAAWAAASDWPNDMAAPLLLDGGLPAWQGAGRALESSPDLPADADCIDYLFFVHDRHDGNKDAARRYLAWETGLVAQLDAQERAGFNLPEAVEHHTPG